MSYDDDYDLHHHNIDDDIDNPLFQENFDDEDDEALLAQSLVVDFDDPEIAALPSILLMGPRRAGKTSIQVR